MAVYIRIRDHLCCYEQSELEGHGVSLIFNCMVYSVVDPKCLKLDNKNKKRWEDLQ